jgi:putative SOS response-associated peptidase YedK
MCAVDKVQTAGDSALMDAFGMGGQEPIGGLERVHYPMRPRLVVRQDEGQRSFEEMNWGLVPTWAKTPDLGRSAFNARDDSIAQGKPMFRAAFKTRRCLLVATSYLEWRTEDGRKVPYEFLVDGGAPYAYAGLWEHWGEGNEELLSCTMITTEPNELTGDYHNRMPVVLRPEDYERWLDPTVPPRDLLALLAPFPAERMTVKRTQDPRKQNQPPLF